MVRPLCGTPRLCRLSTPPHKKLSALGVVHLTSLFINFLLSRHVKTPSFPPPSHTAAFDLFLHQDDWFGKKKKPKADLSIRSDHWARTLTGQGEPSSAGDFSPFAGHRRGGSPMWGNSRRCRAIVVALVAQAASVQHPYRALRRRGGPAACRFRWHSVHGRGRHGLDRALAPQHPLLQTQQPEATAH